MHITDSELLSDELRMTLERGELFCVSGRPMNIWSFEQKDSHFYECDEVIDMPFAPRLIVEAEISPILNRHLAPEFTGMILTIVGENPCTLDEYRFGVRDELHFSIRAISSVFSSGQI